MEHFITNLIPADKLIHMTVTYSNAVLMLVLTNVSDFAKKLDLPIPQPVTTAQVQKFFVDPIKGTVGGVLTLTNGDRFFYNQGHINVFYGHDIDPFPEDMDPAERHRLWVERFRGTMNMTTNEVIEFAREALRKLDYDPKTVQADGLPAQFSGPWTGDDYLVPHCTVDWKGGRNFITIDVNAEKKQIYRISLAGPYFSRPEPKLDVQPELESEYKKRTQGGMFIRTNAPPHPPRGNPLPRTRQ
jgi:hypothetical protein